MKKLTKKECQAYMQRSKSNKYCFYKGKTFQQIVEDDGDTQYWKDCDVPDEAILPN